MTFLAFGNHTVRSILNSPYFSIRKILLLDKYRNDKELLENIEKKRVPYQLLDKEQFSRYSFDKKNQGIVAFIRNYDYFSLTSLLSTRPQHNFPLIILLDSIEDPHNLGAILRTCAALKVDGIIIAKKNQVPVNNTVIKVSMGGVAYVPVCQVNNLGEAIEEIKKKDYKIIATICESRAEEYNKLTFDFPTCSSMTKSLTKLLAKLITWAKKAEVQEAKNKQHFYRLALRYLVNKKNIMTNDSSKEKLSVINKLFTDLGKRYQERQGGYSRITKLKLRRGDNNLRVIFSLV